MKKSISFLLTVLFAIILHGVALKDAGNQNRPRYASNLIKIKLSSEAVSRASLPVGLYAESQKSGLNEFDQLLSRNGGTSIIRAHRKVNDSHWEAETGFDRWFLIKLDGSSTVEEAIASFKANRYVEDAVPEYYAYPAATPNDTYYANNWGHNNTGQLPSHNGADHLGPTVGTIGYDADMQLAWDHSQGYGSSSVVIAIIDSGVDTAHPDLRLVSGYDFGDNDSNPMDDSAEPGHGTCCAGIAAAKANNALGVIGAAGGCSVMPLKIAASNGSMGFTAITNAITYAKDHGADVISMSIGADGAVEGSNPATDAALYAAYNAGVVIFAATANGNTSTISYPSNHTAVISVGASSPTGERKSPSSSDGEFWWGSNYGTATQNDKNAVDIMAPTILPSTDITGAGNGYDTASDYYQWFNGTSCATPYAAGVAALLLSNDPTLTPAEVFTAITSTATDMTIDGGAGWDRYTGYGMINTNAALNSLIPGLPTCEIITPIDYAIINENSTVTINVNATDPNGSISSVAFYIDNVLSYTDYASPYIWDWNSTGYANGNHNIKAIATDNSSNTAEHSINVTLVSPPDEGFESNNFSSFAWVNTSSVPWAVQSTNKFTGTYAAKAGAIGNNGDTMLYITMNVTSPGTLSYYVKVSCETGYDVALFYLDGNLQKIWSGESAWMLQTHEISTGSHTFLWRYLKDSADSAGSDTFWLDHISFPPFAMTYAAPRNLSATAGNAQVSLSWQAPSTGVPTGYKIFRESSYLTTVTGLTYIDNAVSNGTSYAYYLKAVYNGGESAATATVNATPTGSGSSYTVIGTGTSFTNTNTSCPIYINANSLHSQAIYTAAELNTKGVYGPIKITKLGFYVNSAPNSPLSNFVIRMKHTTATNVASWQAATGLQTVYNNASYMPLAGGFQVLTLGTPFTWNGTDNIVVDTAFSPVATTSKSGTVQYTSITNGFRYVSGATDQTNTFTSGSATSYRPNLALSFEALTPQAVPFAEGFEDSWHYWATANGSNLNAWHLGTATAHTGSNSLYISNSSGSSNAYTTTSSAISHVFRDVSFPTGTESYKLRFAWKGTGEAIYDYLKVFLVETSITPTAGTALSSGQLGSTSNLSSTWQETTLDIPAGVNGSTKRLVFSWVNNASGGTNPPIAIDDIRIVAGSQSDAAVIIGNTVTITPPSVTDNDSQVITPTIQITGLNDPADFITVISGYHSLDSGYANAGLDFIFSGADFGGSTLSFTHNLGFVPPNLAYKIGDSGTWNVINNPGDWTTTSASFTVPAAKGPLDVFLTFSNSGDGTLPITLSLFTATLTNTNSVSLYWITATETGVQGYYLYRSEEQLLEHASLVSPLISGTNTSHEQHYQFEDKDTLPATQYYYWLEGMDTDGASAFYGPVGVLTNSGNDTNPPLVPTRTELIGNFPNPFNPSTTLRYSLKNAGEVCFSIWNCRGQLVNRFSKSHNSPGFFSLVFDGKDLNGRSLASGIYYCRMEAEGSSTIRKMLLLK